MRVLHRLISVTAAAAVLAAGTVAAPAYACNDVDVPIENFKLEARWQRKTYHPGDVAKLRVRVSRTADNDPVTGEPWPGGRPMDEPVENASVGVGVYAGRVFLIGGGMTNEDGTVVVKVKIRSYAEPGKARIQVYSQKIVVEDFPSPQCRVVVREWGELDPGPPVMISR